jgi:hypothetical protein
MSLCQYRDALGVPGQGFHSVRLGNVAILDVISTFALAYGIMRLSGKRGWSWYGLILLLTFLLGIGLHWLFCVPTTMNQWIFQ